MNRKSIFNIVKIVIGLGLIGLLVHFIGTSETLSLLASTKWFVIPLLIISILLIALLNAINFYLLAKGIGSSISFRKMFNISMVSWSIARLMPGSVGDISLIPLLKKENIEYGEGAALVVIDKAINLVVLVLLSIYAFIILTGVQNTVINLAFFAGVLAAVGLLFHKRSRSFIRNRLLPQKIRENSAGFSRALKVLLFRRPKILIINFIFTILKVASAAYFFMIIFQSYNLAVPLFTILSIKALGSVAGYIPISPGGLGVKEGVIAFAYTGFGIDPLIPTSVYLMSRFFLFVIAIGIGLFALKNFKLRTEKEENVIA